MELNERDEEFSRTLADLQECDRLAFNHPGRKLAVYENHDGQVVALSLVDGLWVPTIIEIEEVDRVIELLQTAKQDAQIIRAEIMGV